MKSKDVKPGMTFFFKTPIANEYSYVINVDMSIDLIRIHIYKKLKTVKVSFRGLPFHIWDTKPYSDWKMQFDVNKREMIERNIFKWLFDNDYME